MTFRFLPSMHHEERGLPLQGDWSVSDGHVHAAEVPVVSLEEVQSCRDEG